jgi:transcription-repair coupling factor (superfamily II helicase)
MHAMIKSHITVSGAPEGYDAQLILRELEAGDGPVCHVARDDKRMAAMQDALRFFAPDMPVVVFPGWDCLPYDRVSPNADISAARMATLAALVHEMPKRFVLLTTLGAATQRLPARSVLREAAFSAVVGGRVMKKRCVTSWYAWDLCKVQR